MWVALYFVSDRAGKALAATDREALADERYMMEQDKLGPREQVSVQHLLIESEGRSFSELIARTLEILAKIEAGEDFTALVLEYSDDPSAKREGALGHINPGQTLPEFEEMAFSSRAEPGQISGTGTHQLWRALYPLCASWATQSRRTATAPHSRS